MQNVLSSVGDFLIRYEGVFDPVLILVIFFCLFMAIRTGGDDITAGRDA